MPSPRWLWLTATAATCTEMGPRSLASVFSCTGWRKRWLFAKPTAWISTWPTKQVATRRTEAVMRTLRMTITDSQSPGERSDQDEKMVNYDVKTSSMVYPYEEKDDLPFETATRAWLQRVVIGMNLCPFAERPLRDNKLKIDVIRGDDEEIILSLVLAELFLRQKVPGTTLLVCPECYPNDFEQFLHVLNLIENGLMAEHDELVGQVQVAPFHPLFQFEGSGPDSVDNWTNRSPYPIFHILREEEVSHAVDQLDGDASKVWKRNVNLLHALEDELGPEQVPTLMTGQADEALTSRSKEILQQFKGQSISPSAPKTT